MTRPIAVRSVEEEDEILGVCACGSAWRLVAEQVVPIRNHWYDALVVRCSRCGEVHRAVFDITPFFAPPSNAWVRTAC